MRKFLLLGLLVLIALSLYGCKSTKTDLDYIMEKETFIVGFTDFPPMGYEENGKATGFDIELAEAVMEKLGVKLETRYIDWDAKVLELKCKRIDAVSQRLIFMDNSCIIYNEHIDNISDQETRLHKYLG